MRDRTFFFANYEGRRLNTDGILTIAPASAGAINARLIASGYGGPLLAVGSGATTLYPTTLHTDNAFARVDHRFTQRDEGMLRYSLYRLNATNARGVGGLSAVSSGTAVRDTNNTVAASNVFTVSPRLVSETRAQVTIDGLDAPPNDSIGPTVAIAGVATLGRFSSSPTARRNVLGEAVENMSCGSVVPTRSRRVRMACSTAPPLRFPCSRAGRIALPRLRRFRTGHVQHPGLHADVRQAARSHLHNPNLGAYLQDEWHATSRLTVNLGVRYDIEGLAYGRRGPEQYLATHRCRLCSATVMAAQ